MRSEIRVGMAVLIGLLAIELAVAATTGLLADEAYYWVWSSHLAAGYYDQPPAIAWVLGAVRAVIGDSPLALRSVPLVMGLLVPAVLLRDAGDRSLWLVWCAALPPLAWLTLFATPDALLLGAWAVGLAGAIRGGRGWLVAGLAAGIAFESKHTGALLYPLLCVATPGDARTRWPWLGGLVALALALPNLIWNAGHGWVTVRFQLEEGLRAGGQGGWGPLVEVLGQLGVVTPIAALVGYAWCVALGPRVLGGAGSRVQAIAWWTSAPVLLGFALAAIGGRPDAHWPAPAWIGVGLGLSHATGRWLRTAWLGVGVALSATLLLAVHAITPVLPLPEDPGRRLTEGPLLAEVVGRWALPIGVAARDPRAAEGMAVYTERYQEAAFIHYYTGIPARVLPGCGRPGQYDLWTGPPVEAGLFVRPATSGPPHCAARWFSEIGSRRRLDTSDDVGRTVGPWDLFEVEGLRENPR